ncbi:Uncharacterized protein conserved in bacteria [Chlamydia abortus]|jgi:uncharacterized protein YktB (UPF0637 family)|uniref:UPF0637 protein ACFQ03_11645 n=1 Tax=Paenibacillus residui TaxID=629724 RepID=A0ABW3D8X8_9BACL|nr:DUF1054 domain-containing protein [Aneurinibacillus sp. XH2]SHE10533.1 Uncharacterized protein conserved in bacteria [Chlamydia abortus]
MTFQGFSQQDFKALTIDGLEPRMEAIIGIIRPKLTELGELLAPSLSALCGEPMFPHVAKHARRTVNPPNDTWVAWANNRRGYKAHPHFQLGLWSTHLFLQFAIIYESTNKAVFADKLLDNLAEVKQAIPDHFYWSDDHTRPETVPHRDMNEEDWIQWMDKLKKVKKAEVLCGLRIERNDPLLKNGKKLIGLAEQTFETLVPLYRIAF